MIKRHICRVCRGGNKYPPDTIAYAIREFALARHELFNLIVDALRISDLARWLNGRMTR